MQSKDSLNPDYIALFDTLFASITNQEQKQAHLGKLLAIAGRRPQSLLITKFLLNYRAPLTQMANLKITGSGAPDRI